MKRKLRMAAVAVAVAVAVATVAAMFARSTGSDRKTADRHIVGDKVLEMLFCIPGMNCRAMWSTPSFGTATSAASSFAFCGEEAA